MTARPLELLLVDDNEDDLLLMQEALAGHAAIGSARIANGGAAAFAILRGEPRWRPDLIILDLNMPILDGFGVLRVLKEDPTLRGIPVLVVTASGREADVTRAYDAGAATYFQKPLHHPELIELVAALDRYWAGAALPPRKAV